MQSRARCPYQICYGFVSGVVAGFTFTGLIKLEGMMAGDAGGSGFTGTSVPGYVVGCAVVGCVAAVVAMRMFGVLAVAWLIGLA